MSDSRKNTTLIFITFIIAGILSFHQIRCDDQWWHVATGRLILEKRAIPEFDVFSFTYYGAPWHNNELGFSVLAALLWDSWGEIGFFLYRWLTLFGMVAFSLLTIGMRTSRRGVADISPWFSLFALFFLFLALQMRINVRPHMLEYLFISFTLWQIQRSPRDIYRFSSLLWVLPFLAVWFFLHPSWIIAPILILFAFLDNFLEMHRVSFIAWANACSRRFLWMIFFAFAFFLLITGWSFLYGPLSLYRVHFSELTLFEWRPYHYWFSIYPLYVVTLVYYFLTLILLPRLFRTNPFMCFAIIATGFSSLTAFRFVAEFVLVSAPFVFADAFNLFSQRSKGVAGKQKIIIAICAIAMGVTLLGDAILLNRSWGIGVDKKFNPVLAADFMQREGLEGNLFANMTMYHSYISFRMWPAIKIFIDGRTTQVYPMRFIREYPRTPVLNQVEQYPIEYILNSLELSDIRRDDADILENRAELFDLIYFNDSWALYALQPVLDRHANIKPFRMLYPANLADEDLMKKIKDEGKMPLLREELAYYGSIAVDPSEKRLYELMRAEIAKYGTVD